MERVKAYIPDYMPKELERYDSKVMQLEVGKSGKVGVLDLELRGNEGKTIVTNQFSQVPLQVQRALYPEESLPGMAYIYVLSSSGGILQGDRYKTDIVLRDHAVAHITSQGATRIYGMQSNSATHVLDIMVDENCYLEYVPDQIIPYKNSRYYQEVNLRAHDNSTLIYSEIVTPGRMAMGESFEYDICYLRTNCKNQDSKFRFVENVKIEPKKQKIKDFGILGEYDISGTVYILTTKEKSIEIECSINDFIKNIKNVFVGTSLLPDESGTIVKILSNKTDSVFEVIFTILQICRKRIMNATFNKTRKC